jgi:hypothetical protein
MQKSQEAVKFFSQAGEKAQLKDSKTALHMFGLAAHTAFKMGDKHRAQHNLTLGLHIWNRLPEKNRTGVGLEGVRLLAGVQFGLLDEKVSALYGLAVTDGEKVVEQFGKIKADAGNFEQKYMDVVKLGNAEAGVAALYRVAEIREFLANVLLKSPVPKGASPEEVEEFRSNIEKIALPMSEEASKLYAAAWQKSNESEAVTPFQQRLHDKLAVLNPAEFRTVGTEMPSPLYYNSEIVLAPETERVLKN